MEFSSAQIIYTDSGFYLTQFNKNGCKDYLTETRFYPRPKTFIAEQVKQVPLLVQTQPSQRPKFLTVHGNIYYDFFYRSAIDTPISQQNFQQHTERIYLDILVKEKFPFKVSLMARQSNSPYFRNFFDPNFQFDRYTYTRNLKQRLLTQVNAQLPQKPDLKMNEAALNELMSRYAAIKGWLESPSTAQKIIEEREKKYNDRYAKDLSTKSVESSAFTRLDSLQTSKTEHKDSILAKGDVLIGVLDSTKDSYARRYSLEKDRLDSLAGEIRRLQKRVDSTRNNIQKDLLTARQKIYKATSDAELKKIASENGLSLDQPGKFERQLAAIKNFSIGRSFVNYTELTAQNITITGINVEYGSSVFYAAIAAGKIDYRFRDFYNRKARPNNQYLVMGRLGVGNTDRMALIFSLFQGRKNNSAFSLSDSIRSYVNILGYSIEALYKRNANTSISFEFAKSTKPVSGNLQTGKQTSALWHYSDKSNMGLNIKAQTIIPETNTRLSGFYRKTGENFQSFSLFTYNTDQTAWLLRADQSFLKNRVTLAAMLRRNDFSNPFADKTYKTSTVFKSILLSVRFPKYPAVSVGYYPGTQLYLVNKERIRESAYYILNGSVVYSYLVKGISMNSSFVFNLYTNEATDSGFVPYRGTNYYAMHSVYLQKLQLQGAFSFARLSALQYYTLETAADYSIRQWLKLGAGAKYNKVYSGADYWGGRLQMAVQLKQFGMVQLQYEKSYLPTMKQTLYPAEIGRVSYYKSF